MRSPKILVPVLLAILVASATAAHAADLTPRRLESVAFWDTSRGLAVGGMGNMYGHVLRTTDGGVSWETTPVVPGYSLEPQTWFKGISVAPGGGGVIASQYQKWGWTSANFGASWSPSVELTVPGFFNWRGVDMATATRGWKVGSRDFDGRTAVVYGTSDGGLTWRRQFEGPFHPAPNPNVEPPSTNAWLNAVDAVSGGTVAWAVGREHDDKIAGPIAYRTIDGSTWLTDTIPAVNVLDELRDVSAVNNTTAFAVGSYRSLYKTTDGSSWTGSRPASWDTRGSYYSLHFANATTGWVVGSGGLIYKTTDGGTTWTKQASGTNKTLRAVTFVDALHGWAVGDDQMIVRTTDGGANWTVANTTKPVAIALYRSPGITNYGQWAKVYGYSSALRELGSSARVILEYSTDNKTWKTYTTVAPKYAGFFVQWVRPYSKTYYRMRYEGSVDYESAASNSVAVTPRAYLQPPRASYYQYRNRAFTIYGYMKPRHPLGYYSVRLQFFRYESGKWRYRKTVVARNVSHYYSYTKYSIRTSLPYSGRWRVRTYHNDTGHYATYSGYRYLYVR